MYVHADEMNGSLNSYNCLYHKCISGSLNCFVSGTCYTLYVQYMYNAYHTHTLYTQLVYLHVHASILTCTC